MTLRNLGRPVRRHAGRHGSRGGYEVGWIFESGDFTTALDHLVILEIEPGGEVGEHLHEEDDEIYLVLAGRGILHLDGEPYQMAEGDAMLTTPGHRHRLENDGTESLRVLVVNCRKSQSDGDRPV